jgi:hypothetical protein
VKTVVEAWKETFVALREAVITKYKKKEGEAASSTVASA